MEDWTKIGTKKLADAPISSLAVSRDGKSLALYVELNLSTLLLNILSFSFVVFTFNVVFSYASLFSFDPGMSSMLSNQTSFDYSNVSRSWIA